MPRKTRYVTLRVPETAWDTIRKTLELDSKSAAFDSALRSEIAVALAGVEIVSTYGELPSDAKFRDAANGLKSSNDEEIDIDSNAVVSRGDDGAYVAAWVYVTNKEAGIRG